jgi:hypothetical protein
MITNEASRVIKMMVIGDATTRSFTYVHNGKQSTVNKSLDGSMFPG